MNRQALIAGALAAVVGGFVGVACSTPQPPAECNFQPSYWMALTLTDAGTGSCTGYEGDLVGFQRYSPPGQPMTFGLLPRRVGAVTRNDPCTGGGRDGVFFRTDTTPGGGRETAIGTLASYVPDNSGLCTTSAFAPAEQTYPRVTEEMCIDAGVDLNDGDGGWAGSEATAADFIAAMGGAPVHVKYDWANFRMLSTARFVQNVWEADLAVTNGSCNASFHVQGVFPAVPCVTDEECNPSPNLDAGRATGSGLSPDFTPRCFHFANRFGYEAQRFGLGVASWSADTKYAEGEMVYNAGSDGSNRVYVAAAGGTSGAADAGAAGPDGTANGQVDGTVTWDYVNPGTTYLYYSGICRPAKVPASASDAPVSMPIDDLVPLK